MASRSETDKTLNQLEKYIQELVRKYEVADQERADYLAQLEKTKTELQNANDKIEEQEKKLEHYELKQAFFSGNSTEKRARRKLGKIIKEIDKCILLLND